jgi:hypothetical protein
LLSRLPRLFHDRAYFIQFNGLAVGGFGFGVALRVVLQQVAEVVPRPGNLLVQFDGLAVGGFGFGVALRVVLQQVAEVVPRRAVFSSSSMALR